MNAAVLGSGIVGRTISAKLAQIGHHVVSGTRDVENLLGRTEPEMGGNVPPFTEWHEQNPSVDVATFAEAAAAVEEIVFNATNGAVSLDVLALAGEGNLDGKILIDISNPLDFSGGFPPTLLVSNTDSLAERIQLALPIRRSSRPLTR